jgi:hypothetical protein
MVHITSYIPYSRMSIQYVVLVIFLFKNKIARQETLWFKIIVLIYSRHRGDSNYSASNIHTVATCKLQPNAFQPYMHFMHASCGSYLLYILVELILS